MNTNISKYISFLAISFSGAYKFLIVFLYSFFFNEQSFAQFSEQYFWLLAIWSLTGMPFSLLMSSKRYYPSVAQSIFFIVTSNALLSSLLPLFLSLSIFDYFIFFLASVFASLYEVVKKHLLDREEYNSVFIAGFISFVLLFVYIFSAHSDENIQRFALLFAFLAIFAPITVFYFTASRKNVGDIFNSKDLCTKFFQYSFSNLLSTSIGYFVPILLVMFLGSNYAGQIAEINSAARILLMIPIALAARNIPRLKSGLDAKKAMISYVQFINIFVFAALIFSSAVLFFLYTSNVLLYILMVSALFIPQLALPYSNLLAVEDKSFELLTVNLIGVVSLLFLLCLSFLIFTNDTAIVFSGMICLNIHFIIKYFLTKDKAMQCLGANK